MRIALLLGLVFWANAIGPAQPPAGEDAGRRIAPYLDEQTLLVIRLDLSRIDLAAVRSRFPELLPPNDEGEWKTIERVLTDLGQAGGRELFLVLSFQDLTPLTVVPIPAGANAERIVQALAAVETAMPRGFEARRQGEHVLFGPRLTLKRWEKDQPAARPQVARALAAAPGMAIGIALVPTADLRRVLDEVAPALPAIPGGGDIKLFTRGLQWAVLGFDLPPRPALQVVIQASDAATARGMRDTLRNLFALLALDPQVRKLVPDADGLTLRYLPRQEEERLILRVEGQELMATLKPLFAHVRQQAEQAREMNDLRQIGLAFHNYASVHGPLPAAAIYDKEGKALLSWRVALLPYLEAEGMYREFRLNEPWDSEHNRKLITRMPKIYQGRNAALNKEGKTTCVVPVGPDTIFSGKEGTRFQDIKDGTSNTILALQTDDEHAVIWTRPDDLTIDPKNPAAGVPLEAGCLALFGDGSVRRLPASLKPATLKALFTRSGGEVVQLP